MNRRPDRATCFLAAKNATHCSARKRLDRVIYSKSSLRSRSSDCVPFVGSEVRSMKTLRSFLQRVFTAETYFELIDLVSLMRDWVSIRRDIRWMKRASLMRDCGVPEEVLSDILWEASGFDQEKYYLLFDSDIPF